VSKLRLGTSTYSFWHFKPEKVPIKTVMQHAHAMGLDGVEILHVQMASEKGAYLQRLKRTAFSLGLDIYCLSIHQDFVSPDAEERERNVAHTLHCIDLAHELGAPSIRLNSGRWGTLSSFDELMAQRGLEPPIPGYTDDDAFGWVIAAVERCLPHAESRGVVLALENHWGLTRSAEGVNRIVESIGSDWLKVTMDCGNFIEDAYASLAKIAPHTILVHAKTYFGGGEWYTLDLDYRRIAGILHSVGFTGYVSLEYEGREDPMTAVPKSIELLRQSFKRPKT
jgi:L-ribulose-5-phosphate 3-epimerase